MAMYWNICHTAPSVIIKPYWHNGLQAPLHYFRDKNMKEIDLLIVRDGAIHPVEFKKTASPKKDAAANFRLLEKLKTPIGCGAVVCLCGTTLPLAENVEAIPASSF